MEPKKSLEKYVLFKPLVFRFYAKKELGVYLQLLNLQRAMFFKVPGTGHWCRFLAKLGKPLRCHLPLQPLAHDPSQLPALLLLPGWQH